MIIFLTMNKEYNMDQFFNWLTKPMSNDEIDAWYKANNIIPEMRDLFEDFCLSLFKLIDTTYLGDSDDNGKETKIGMTVEDKEEHFKWCWNRTISNFKNESIIFNDSEETYDYFKNFFMEVFYNQKENNVRKSIEKFFITIFRKNNKHTKSDIEMLTEIYKILEKSLII